MQSGSEGAITRDKGAARELAEHDWPTMNHYADAKTDIIEAILGRAQQRT